MTNAEFEMLQDLIARPEVTMFARLSETQVLPFYAVCSAAYVRLECPDRPGTWENYPAVARIALFPRASMTGDELKERDRKLLEEAMEKAE